MGVHERVEGRPFLGGGGGVLFFYIVFTSLVHVMCMVGIYRTGVQRFVLQVDIQVGNSRRGIVCLYASQREVVGVSTGFWGSCITSTGGNEGDQGGAISTFCFRGECYWFISL